MHVLVTGSRGMLGRAVCHEFEKNGFDVIRVHRDLLDLRDFSATLHFFSQKKIDLIVHCAALVGGIKSNIMGKDNFFTENVLIDYSVLFTAKKLEVKNLIYIGSSCMYPSNMSSAIKETDFLTGKLEKTNESYALAKIFGVTLTNSIANETGFNWKVFVSSNLYGPNDYFHPIRSHLIGAIVRKVVFAKQNKLDFVEMWGDGTPRREFTFIKDFVEWIVQSSAILNKLPNLLNVGCGIDYTVLEYYQEVLKIFKLDLKVIPNIDIPNGTSRKLMDSSLARSFGWKPKTSIAEGISETIRGYYNSESRR